jgi:hypothetical protein
MLMRQVARAGSMRRGARARTSQVVRRLVRGGGRLRLSGPARSRSNLAAWQVRRGWEVALPQRR